VIFDNACKIDKQISSVVKSSFFTAEASGEGQAIPANKDFKESYMLVLHPV